MSGRERTGGKGEEGRKEKGEGREGQWRRGKGRRGQGRTGRGKERPYAPRRKFLATPLVLSYLYKNILPFMTQILSAEPLYYLLLTKTKQN